MNIIDHQLFYKQTKVPIDSTQHRMKILFLGEKKFLSFFNFGTGLLFIFFVFETLEH